MIGPTLEYKALFLVQLWEQEFGNLSDAQFFLLPRSE